MMNKNRFPRLLTFVCAIYMTMNSKKHCCVSKKLKQLSTGTSMVNIQGYSSISVENATWKCGITSGRKQLSILPGNPHFKKMIRFWPDQQLKLWNFVKIKLIPRYDYSFSINVFRVSMAAWLMTLTP